MQTYGPHDPATAPDSGLVLADKRWPERNGQVIPLPPGLIRQRRDLNTRAAGTDRATWRQLWLEATP